MGCAGKKYALFDAVNWALYFVARSTMAYAGVSRLPATAPASSTFGISYAHDQLYLFNYTTRIWSIYSVLGNVMAAQDPAAAPRLELVPNPVREQVRVVGATGPLRLLDLTGWVVREQATGEVVATSGLAPDFYVIQTAAGTARLQLE